MIINHNMNAMNAHRMMSGNTAAAGKSMEKLSSGLRINRAGDDAAGLAISEKMRGQIRGLDQASRNAEDGISMIQTAEGGLNETHSMLQRVRELVVQANNGTNTAEDRTKIQDEVAQLTTEITNISNRTEFNSQKLLDGSFGAKVNNIGTNVTGKFTIENTGAKVETGYKITTGIGGGAVEAEIEGDTLVDGDIDFATQANADPEAIHLTIDGEEIGDVDVSALAAQDYADGAAGATSYDSLASDLETAINAAIDTYNTANNKSVAHIEVENNAGKLRLTSGTNGADDKSEITVGAAGAGTTDVASALGLDTKTDVVDNSITIENETLGISEKIQVTDTSATEEGTTITFQKMGVTLKVDDGDATTGETINVGGVNSVTGNNDFDVTGGSVDLQIGANASQQMSLSINAMDSTTLGIADIDVSAVGYDSAQFDLDLAKIDNNAITTVSA